MADFRPLSPHDQSEKLGSVPIHRDTVTSDCNPHDRASPLIAWFLICSRMEGHLQKIALCAIASSIRAVHWKLSRITVRVSMYRRRRIISAATERNSYVVILNHYDPATEARSGHPRIG
jgi:hypothetical protein